MHNYTSYIRIQFCDTMQSWRDEYLMWNPGNYGDVERLHVETAPNPSIWLPDMHLFNA